MITRRINHSHHLLPGRKRPQNKSSSKENSNNHPRLCPPRIYLKVIINPPVFRGADSDRIQIDFLKI